MAIITIQGSEEKNLHIHYEVDTSLPPIGAGGMGQVFRGVRVEELTGVRRDAAIKFMFDDLPESAIERTRREASVKIHNENLVEMFGFIEVGIPDSAGNVHKRYHVASELLNGVMLHDLMRGKTTDVSGNEMEFARELYRQYSCDRMRFAIFIIRNILSGVMALHDAGYIHRDIDPSNVMITSDGKVKLIDFGICKKLDSLGTGDRHLTSAGQFMGKAAYAAPELVTGDVAHQDETTDIYAIGIMFYELLTGNVPFDGSTHEVLARQLKEDIPVKNLTDKAARPVIRKATAKKQSARYASAAEFRVAVEQLSRNSKVTSGGTNPGIDSPVKLPADKKKIAIFGGAAAAAVALIAIGIAAFSGGGEEKEDDDLIARQQLIESRKTEIADMIIDDMSTVNRIDSLTGLEIPTAGSLISQAKMQLTSATTAGEGINLLKKVADRKMKSSAEALALLAALNSRSQTLDESILSSTDSLFAEKDYRLAHELNNRAVELNGDNYHALYELALDYMAGDARGVVDRDIAKATELFTKARKAAETSGDSAFVGRIDIPLQQLGADNSF